MRPGGGALVALACAMASAPAWADAPPAAPAATVCSLSGEVCATREPASRSTVVWRRLPRGGRATLWRAGVLPVNIQVSDDGRTLVELYPGSNLLDARAGPGAVVLTFHHADRAPATVRLDQVIARPEALPRTESNRLWANAYGFDAAGRYVLETAEGRRFLFDPATGRPIKGALLRP